MHVHTHTQTQQVVMWESSFTHTCLRTEGLKNKNIYSQFHTVMLHCTTCTQTPASSTQSYEGKRHIHTFTFTSHIVIHKVIWASHRGGDCCSRQWGLSFIQPWGLWLGWDLEPCREKLLNRTARSESSQMPPRPLTFLTSLHQQRLLNLQLQDFFYNVRMLLYNWK